VGVNGLCLAGPPRSGETSRPDSRDPVASGVNTTGATGFPECLKHSGKSQKHLGKPSPSATLGEELPGKRLTGKRSSPSATVALEEDLTPLTGFIIFFTLPRVQHSGKKFSFF
jgi:hypothetical protein